MQPVTFEQDLEKIVAADIRYHPDAYRFLREALDYTQRNGNRAKREEMRHVTGKELLEGIRAFALERFGPMAPTVLESWGVRSCEDFGELVFNLVEYGLLAKTETDSREDFKDGYDFYEVFRKPFLPSTVAEPKSVQV